MAPRGGLGAPSRSPRGVLYQRKERHVAQNSYPGAHRIVRTWSGSRTGETCYLTEDGRVWTTENIHVGTGQTRGDVIVVGDVDRGWMVERP